jgi:hypothetical protein
MGWLPLQVATLCSTTWTPSTLGAGTDLFHALSLMLRRGPAVPPNSTQLSRIGDKSFNIGRRLPSADPWIVAQNRTVP